MENRKDLQKKAPQETYMEHPDYAASVAFFREQGWNVIEGNRSLLEPAVDELQCGDGRYANLVGPLRKAGKALFGGLWGVAALKTGGDENGLAGANALVRAKGIRPAVHGDHHGEISCGLFNVWKGKLLDGIKGVMKFALPENGALREMLRSLHIPVIELPGEHAENQLVISFVPGKTPKLDPHAFRLNGELASEFGINLHTYLESSAEAVRLLTKDRPQGPVKTVTLIK